MVNAVLNAPNSFGEVKIDKMTQQNRIDPCDAVIDAWKLYLENKGEKMSEGEDALANWLSAIERARAKK
jgi:phage terminase large subunit-like protein